MAQLNMTDSGRLPHACLISASTREEALAAAGQAAMAAVCSGTGKKPCGLCRDCRKAGEHIHPDIILVGRLTDDKGRQKQNISVDQIRAMSADACVLPNEAERKVYIIDEAETMNIPAQNAALKLLEEPPAGTVFLLCTVNAMQLLPTVRSRCAQFSLSGQSAKPEEGKNELAASYLKAVAGGDPAQLLRWCASNEDLDVSAALEFTDSVRRMLADILCGRQKSRNLSRGDIMRLIRLMDRCTDMLKVNTGVKHIFGLLAVNSLADSVNRGKTN